MNLSKFGQIAPKSLGLTEHGRSIAVGALLSVLAMLSFLISLGIVVIEFSP
jgi:hypothetical protein